MKANMICAAAALLLLTGCGSAGKTNQTPDISDNNSSAAESAADDTALNSTADISSDTETAAASVPQAGAVTEAAVSQTTENSAQNAPQTAEPLPDSGTEQPILTAVCIEDTVISGGRNGGQITQQDIAAGTELEVISFESSKFFSENLINFRIGEDVYTGAAHCFLLTPTDAYLASASETALCGLAEALCAQYSDLFVSFQTKGGTLGLSETQTYDNNWQLLEPPRTWADLLTEYRKYFTDDLTNFSGTGESYNGLETIAASIIEKDGSLWRMTGYGGPDIPTKFSTDGIRSRSDSEIVFDMTVINDMTYIGRDITQYQTTFAIRSEDGIWKCSQIYPQWFMQ